MAESTRTGSFEEFVLARSASLYRTAYLMTGRRAEAEDLLQTALIKLYVAWPRASIVAAPEAYARRVLVNTFISGRRPARFTRERLVRIPPDLAVDDPDLDDRLTLWPLVVSLPPRQRAVIVLRYYGGLSESEIAHALRCAPGTVKSTASAALRSLRMLMGELR
ncbi:MAG: SigE family polymerase sigma factor [Nocardioides sp.]|nr:SigE family polymerase sigma factor [Nocardioides sp.]